MKLFLFSALTLVSSLFLTACGQGSFSSDEDLLMDQAQRALESAPTSNVAFDSQNTEVGKLLGYAYPQHDEVVLTPASMARSAVSGTRPNGVQYSRRSGQYLTSSGYTVFGGQAKRYNPANGNAASAGGLWIPSVGAVGYAVAYIPSKGFALAIGAGSQSGGAGVICTTSGGCQTGGY